MCEPLLHTHTGRLIFLTQFFLFLSFLLAFCLAILQSGNDIFSERRGREKKRGTAIGNEEGREEEDEKTEKEKGRVLPFSSPFPSDRFFILSFSFPQIESEKERIPSLSRLFFFIHSILAYYDLASPNEGRRFLFFSFAEEDEEEEREEEESPLIQYPTTHTHRGMVVKPAIENEGREHTTQKKGYAGFPPPFTP